MATDSIIAQQGWLTRSERPLLNRKRLVIYHSIA